MHKENPLPHLSIQKNLITFGPNKGREMWEVCYREVPVGPMLDFHIEEVKTKFPFRRTRNEFESMDEAQKAVEVLKQHMREVMALPVRAKSFPKVAQHSTTSMSCALWEEG